MFCQLFILFYFSNTFHFSINNCQLFEKKKKNCEEIFATENNKNVDILLSAYEAFL